MKPIEHKDKLSAVKVTQQQVAEAVGAHQWLTLAVQVLPNGKIQVAKTSHNFPIGRLDEVISVISENFQAHHHKKPQPLPVVDLPDYMGG